MTGFEFIASLIGHIAWPIAAIVAAFVFRAPISGVLDRLQSLKAFGGEAELITRATEAAEDARSALRDIPDLEAPAALDGTESPELRVPRGEDPTFSVIAAWERIGSALTDLGRLAGLDLRGTPLALLRDLRAADAVNERFVDSVTELSRIRTRVAHGGERVSVEAAEAYVEAANELIRAAGAIGDFKYVGPVATY